MAKKKVAAYIEYALYHRKKYDKLAKKQLSIPELVNYANLDWKNEPDKVKDYFKAIAKGETAVQDPSVHETSSHRLDTEAPVVTDMSIGEQLNQRRKAQVGKVSDRFKTCIKTVEDILDCKIGVIDFNVYVDYLDGLSVPAEFGIARGTVREGLTENSVYSELIKIDPLNPSHLRLGFRNEVKNSCELVHGIDAYSSCYSSLTLEEFCREVGDEIPPNTLLLCRSEDVRRVLGSWYWLKKRSPHLPKIELMTIEDFLVTTTKLLVQLGRGGTVSRATVSSQFTELLSKPTHDTATSFRCQYHNSAAACDKSSCTKKNTKKYFFMLVQWLAEFLPEVKLENGKHYYESPRIERRAGKEPLVPRVPSNSRAEPHVECDYPETHEVPRRPMCEVVYSARGECSKGSKPTSNQSSPVTLHAEPETTVVPQLPRRPKLDPNKPSAKSCTSSFQKSAYTYDNTVTGAKALDPTPAPQHGTGAAPINNSVRSSHQPGPGGIGRGRSRRGSSSPPSSTPPGYQTATPGYQTAPVPPGYTSLPIIPLPSHVKGNGVSFGRGQRFAAAQVTQVTETRAPFVSDIERAERGLNGMTIRD